VKRLVCAILSAGLISTIAGALPVERLTTVEIERIIAQAASKAMEYTNNPISRNAVIAVADREGYIVGAWRLKTISPGNPKFAAFLKNALGRAGTASYLSSSEHAFSTRTAAFIVQQHFPTGIENAPPGPLVGVNFSNLDRSDVNRFKNPATYNPALTNGLNGKALPPLITGGLTGASGGVPLYKNGRLVGAIGVCGDEAFGEPLEDKRITIGTARPTVASAVTNTLLYELLISPELVYARDVEEEVALAGQFGFAPDRRLWGSKVFVAGLSLAYIASEPVPAQVVLPLASIAEPVTDFPTVAPPAVQYPPLTLGGVNGELRQPLLDDPALHDADPANDTIRGQARLTAAEVRAILDHGANRARTTRGGIRLPRGRQMQCFISVVANPNKDGVAPAVLGTFCTSPDTTRFSWDVAVQKARTALFFSDDTRAFSSRTVGFLAQKFYPPGIADTQPGIFLGLQERFCSFNYNVQNPLNDALVSDPTKLFLARVPPNPNLPNGITIFPGGFPLYRNGVIIGAVGVSGDGIDQDDIVSASATRDFPTPLEIRADRFSYRGARLPYAKFPRNPAL
jgi:uncharacterized protein GlcG (DUF336 family)